MEVTMYIYDDPVNCNHSSIHSVYLRTSGFCNHLDMFRGSSDIWDCGAAEEVYVISSQSFATPNCDSAPITSRYNYYGECKDRILHSCNHTNNSVTYSTCTDAECQQCTPTATVPVDRRWTTKPPTCKPNPLPGVYDYPGAGFQLTSVSLGLALKHTWFSSNNCTNTTPHTANDGHDFIVLNVCNNGWIFRCINNGK